MSRLAVSSNNTGTVGQNTLKTMVNDERTQKKFRELLGNKAPGFLTSLLNTINGNKQLQNADPSSIMKAGAIAAALDLPIDQNFGYAYVVPYNNKGKNEAQFQMGYKGFIQLAIRSGQYKKINVTELYEGQFISYDPIRDVLKYDLDNKKGDEITHYIAYFETVNGFEKFNVMSREEIEEHAQKFSKTYNYNGSSWKTNFDMMAKKTVLKLLISKFGILSIEMQTAQKVDQAVIKEVKDGNNVEVEYVDNPMNDKGKVNTTNEIIDEIPLLDEEDEELEFDSSDFF